MDQREREMVALAAPHGALRATRWGRGIWRALRRNPNMLMGVVVLLFMVFIAVFAPLITRTDPTRTNPFDRLESPSARHWFGTDHLGVDVYDRTVFGSRVSLGVGFSVGVIVTVVGMAIGLVAGYYRKVDNIIMRFMDALMAFPTILLALALIALLGSSLQNVIIVISVVDTPYMVRVIRASVLSLREQVFVEAARAIGAPVWRILVFHIAPNTFASVMVQATVVFAGAVLTEAGLSFLGAGVPPYIPSWGNIMGQGRSYVQVAIWITFFPGLFLSFTVLAINLVGDGLRDALDPKLRRRM